MAAQESATPSPAESPIAEPQETAAMAVSPVATLFKPQPGYGFIPPSAQHIVPPEGCGSFRARSKEYKRIIKDI